MTDQPVKLKALRDELLRASGKYHKDATCVEFANELIGLLDEAIADFSRTDAARVEAEAKATKLDGEANELAQLNNMLLKRIASLESDLSAVTASSVEHAKTIDGLRAELARAIDTLRILSYESHFKDRGAMADFARIALAARSATHSADTGGKG